MRAYIRSATSISPQKTFNESSFIDDVVEYTDNRLNCVEPDYSQIIDPKLIRRMGRLIRMGVASALACLKDAGIEQPDAIVTGTAYGCLEDTGIFLANMIEFDEEPVSPTAFVHSTHNTIGAQIALFIKCHRYNNTFVSAGASFENGLLDALMLIVDDESATVLTGGMDEITNVSHAILSRFGLYKQLPLSNLKLFDANGNGTINGEGSAFFLLTGRPSVNDMARIDGLKTFYKPVDLNETMLEIESFLQQEAICAADIDLLILGNNGDKRNDAIYANIQQSVFPGIPTINYKHLCGEYPTSTAFALWLGVNIIKQNHIPAILAHPEKTEKRISKVLIYNHYQNNYHSLILLSSC